MLFSLYIVHKIDIDIVFVTRYILYGSKKNIVFVAFFLIFEFTLIHYLF